LTLRHSDGEIDVYNSTERRMKHRYFFLFNDVLLLTKKEGSRRFWLKVYISLRTSLRVEDVPDTASPYRGVYLTRARCSAPSIHPLTHSLVPFDRSIDWIPLMMQ